MVKARDVARYAPTHLRDWAVDDDGWRMVDGTLCLVDISGFTALSERLSALGRIGAEELTEVLGSVFGEMLDVATARGGTLLKFGGDALLLLFESADHAVQAASAAVEMRAVLRTSKDIPTSVGRLALRMSQGIHSGEVLLIHAVGSHRELIIAGPTASWVAHMESIANANEIVVSEATRVLLPTSSVSKSVGDGGLLRWRTPKVDPVDADSVGSAMSSTHGTSHIPIALRDHLASGAVDSEHRQATVGFIKVAGADDLIADLGLAATAEAVQRLVVSIMDIADEEAVTFLGTDVDANVFKVILVSGVPSTVEDEEGRLLRVARRVADIDTPLSISIGVNRGHVFSGEIGVEERATYTIMGDTVNLAARLMQAAPPGSVYATPAVADRSLSLFETSEVEPLHVKGKADAVRSISLGAETGSRALTTDEDGIFVGRLDELKTLRDALAAVHDGDGASFVISGPTGIGKTRLLNEVLGDTEATIIALRAEPYGTSNPYRPFRDPVRELIGIDEGSDEGLATQLAQRVSEIDDELIAHAPLLGDIAHIDMPPTPETEHISGEFRQDRAADALIDLLDRITGNSLVLSFEDAHWADAASSALLVRLVRATSDRPWLLIQTGRGVSSEDSTLIDLPPLLREQVEALVYAEAEAAPLRPDVVDAIVERSGGSPLFAHELVDVIKTTGDADSLPTSLEGVIGSQIDRLEPLARRVLRYVSVLGRSFRTSVAGDLVHTQGAYLDSATRSALTGFLDDAGKGRLQFRHAIVRDVAYEGLSFKQRKELHGHAGQLLLERFAGKEDTVADILALHFHSSGNATLSWRFSSMAGELAMTKYANVEAATQFERALVAASRLPELGGADWRRTYLKLGDVRERSGNYEASIAAYRGARRHTVDDPLAHAEVMLRLSRARERAGAFPSALGETTRVLTSLEGDVSPRAQSLRAQALGYAALIRQAQQKPGSSLDLALRAAEAAEAANDSLALARAWRVLDWSYFMIGQPDEAVFSAGALDIYLNAGDLDHVAIIATNMGGFAFFSGDWPAALANYERGRDAALQAGNQVHAANSAANIGELLVNQGRFDEALEALHDAKRINQASGFREGIVFTDILLGRVYGVEGDLERSTTLLESAVSMAETLGIDGWVYEAAIYLAETQSISDSSLRVLDALHSAREHTPDAYVNHYSPLFHRVDGSIRYRMGQHQEAIESLEQGLRAADAAGDTFEHSLLTLVLQKVDKQRVDAASASMAREALAQLQVVRPPLASLNR